MGKPARGPLPRRNTLARPKRKMVLLALSKHSCSSSMRGSRSRSRSRVDKRRMGGRVRKRREGKDRNRKEGRAQEERREVAPQPWMPGTQTCRRSTYLCLCKTGVYGLGVLVLSQPAQGREWGRT